MSVGTILTAKDRANLFRSLVRARKEGLIVDKVICEVIGISRRHLLRVAKSSSPPKNLKYQTWLGIKRFVEWIEKQAGRQYDEDVDFYKLLLLRMKLSGKEQLAQLKRYRGYYKCYQRIRWPSAERKILISRIRTYQTEDEGIARFEQNEFIETKGNEFGDETIEHTHRGFVLFSERRMYLVGGHPADLRQISAVASRDDRNLNLVGTLVGFGGSDEIPFGEKVIIRRETGGKVTMPFELGLRDENDPDVAHVVEYLLDRSHSMANALRSAKKHG